MSKWLRLSLVGRLFWPLHALRHHIACFPRLYEFLFSNLRRLIPGSQMRLRRAGVGVSWERHQRGLDVDVPVESGSDRQSLGMTFKGETEK